ncbi:hypothetical protein BpHYR1_008104 [Brachionus plicatilis]|uniref:Uncharacterized protein n=1 Tax=Brachionus plicatilis TaxID=10195 RepID=A0A3M7QYH6_BRAPC|nr:hypothetical protein BpHYR1_008104 [Brachionus plicatilis]
MFFFIYSKRPPPPSSLHLILSTSLMGIIKLLIINRISPIDPLNLVHKASMKNIPFSFAALNTSSWSCLFKLIGFSHRTCLPALIALRQTSLWVLLVVPM